MKKKGLDCQTCLQNEIPCENLIGLYKLDQLTEGLDVTMRLLKCPKNGLQYELKPKEQRRRDFVSSEQASVPETALRRRENETDMA